MKIRAYKRFKRTYRALPKNIQKKANKQLLLFSENMHHPSLHTKKIKGREGIWEARIDLSYRLTFEIIGETIFLRVAGNHDDVINSKVTRQLN